jgi:hypothetical protein
MAEVLLSPGVFTNENDQSFIQQQPVQAGAAIIGPTVKGPVEEPTVVTSYSDFTNKFGSVFTSASNTYTYFTSIAAYNYFNNGGDSLLITRVVSGAFTSATSTAISSSNQPSSQPAFVLKTITKGSNQNSISPQDSDGALASGSSDNLRWEISQADSNIGTFTLLIRRGDDITDEKVVLETWANLSLDPYAPNYISKVIGDQVKTKVTDSAGNVYLQYSGSYPNQSRYVYISSVKNATPNYFDNSGNPKTQFTGSLPSTGSGSFENATGELFGDGARFYETIAATTNIQGLDAYVYTASLDILSNKDEYQFNTLVMPGVISDLGGTSATTINKALTMAIERGDFLTVIDMETYGATVANVTSEAQTYNNSYTATYWPWCQVADPDTGQLVWVPASTLIPAVYAFNDRNAEAWFAPAGLNRGSLPTVIRTERTLTKSDRDTLYSSNVNPIATFPNSGVVVFGQKTLQKKASALDRVNVRRLLIELKNYIGQLAQNLVFEQNTTATRNAFLSQVNPYLESIQQRQGLYAFRVIMDDSNNTPDVIDRNQLVGQIFLQPTRTAEFIVLDFNVLPTGAEFPS